MGGLASIYLFFENDPLAVNWNGFQIFVTILFFLLFVGLAVYGFLNLEKKKAFGYIIASVLCIGLSISISAIWINNLAALINALGWLFFIIFGLATLILLPFGVLTRADDEIEDLAKTKKFAFVGGVISLVICFFLGWQILHFPFLARLTWSNPYLYGTVTTFLLSVLFNFLINLLKKYYRKSGNSINPSAEWRIQGSNTKYRDATMRETYEHQNGAGSWAKNRRSTINGLRFFACVFATFLPLRMFDEILQHFPMLRFLSQTNFEYFRMMQNQRTILFITLFLLSGIISLYFESISEKRF